VPLQRRSPLPSRKQLRGVGDELVDGVRLLLRREAAEDQGDFIGAVRSGHGGEPGRVVVRREMAREHALGHARDLEMLARRARRTPSRRRGGARLPRKGYSHASLKKIFCHVIQKAIMMSG
jgi:hypothetical protein